MVNERFRADAALAPLKVFQRRTAMLDYDAIDAYGMLLWGIVQDLSQLKGIYGERWQSFIGNA